MIRLLEQLIELSTSTVSSWGFITKSGEIITPDNTKYGAHEDFAFEWLSDKYGGEEGDYPLDQFYDETGYVRFSTTSTKAYSGVAIWIWGDITISQFRVIAKMAREHIDFNFDIYRKGNLLYGGGGFSDFREAIKRLNLLRG